MVSVASADEPAVSEPVDAFSELIAEPLPEAVFEAISEADEVVSSSPQAQNTGHSKTSNKILKIFLNIRLSPLKYA